MAISQERKNDHLNDSDSDGRVSKNVCKLELTGFAVMRHEEHREYHHSVGFKQLEECCCHFF